jgi:quercetin dioxygenase-like cupin family protein
MKRFSMVCALAVLAIVGGYLAGQHEGGKGFAVVTSHDLKWIDPPAILPPGAKVAVLEGDPGKDGPFVMRVRMPDGYRIPPHTHPKPERITVISGTFNVAMGDKFDLTKGRAMPAGAFGTWPAGMKHYVWAKGDTVIQLHGTGPWTLAYLNAKDDPRNQAAGKR